MRQVKFRGFSLNREGWLYGDLAHRTYPNEDGTEEVWTYINSIDRNEEVRRQKNNIFNTAVNPNTIGQFTGLLDHNGKEIYEGDIIKDGDYIFEVYWCNSLASFMHEEYNSKSDAPKIFMMDCISEDAEIVGNIHEQSKS